MTTPSTGHGKELPKFSVDHPPALTPTSTGPGRELSNLAETYTDEAKYSGWNNSFILKLANLWKNAVNSLSKNFRIDSTGGRRLCQAMRWMTWMKWDKTLDEMDETRVGVG